LLRIRLARVGKKKQPTYRVVVADARKPRDGAYVEILGHYNPRTDPTTFEIDADKVRDWLSKGAQPTDRMEKLLAGKGLVPARDWGAASREAAARRAAAMPAPRAAAPAAPPPAAAAPAPAAPTAVAEPEREATTEPEAEATIEAEAEPTEPEAAAETEAEEPEAEKPA
jgi:small subunit ribosomal protein S16